MRQLVLVAALGLLVCACQAGVQAPLPSADGSPPVLDAITEMTVTREGFPVVIPQFHFHDADGDVIFLQREIVETDGPHEKAQGTNVNLPPAMQQRGAIIAGGWSCGANHYHATLRAYLLDRAGHCSNAMTYTIHCNGSG